MDSADGESASRRQFLRTSAGLGSLALAGTGGLAAAALAQAGEQPLPERFDINHLMSPVKDQGERQTCAAFAVVAAAEAAFARDRGQRLVLSEDYLLHKHHANRSRPADETTDIFAMIEAAEKYGFARDEDWPYQPRICPTGAIEPGCPLTPPDIAAIDRKADTLRHGLWYPYGTDENRDRTDRKNGRQKFLATLIWRTQSAVIFNTVLPASHEGWGDDGTLSFPEGLRGASGDVIDEQPGHFAVLTGFDFARREFYFKNSWGPDWGRGGYGTIPFSLIDSAVFRDTVYRAGRPART